MVAPLWKDRSSSGGSRSCTALTKGMVGTPATAVRLPIAAGSSAPTSTASIASPNPAGARPRPLSARASAASAASIDPRRASSEKQARIASVAKSGPRSAESRAEKVMPASSSGRLDP